MSAERDTPRGPTSEQLRRRALQAAAAEAVLTAEDKIRLDEWARQRDEWRRRWAEDPPPTLRPNA